MDGRAKCRPKELKREGGNTRQRGRRPLKALHFSSILKEGATLSMMDMEQRVCHD